MKLEKITDKKFRIIIYTDELKKKNINLHTFFKDKELSQNFISSILKDAEAKLGFELDKSKLLVEAFSSDDDFLILTCTMINIKNHSKLINSVLKNKSLLYKFDSFEDFCEFCIYINNISNVKYLQRHMVLYEYNLNYYLYIPETSYDNSNILFTSILEFAQLINTKDTINYKIFEYGNIIFKNNAFKNCLKFFY